MTDIPRTASIVLRESRCWKCGRFWAYETFAHERAECPVCAGKLIADLRSDKDKLARAVSALRGVLKRRSKR